MTFSSTPSLHLCVSKAFPGSHWEVQVRTVSNIEIFWRSMLKIRYKLRQMSQSWKTQISSEDNEVGARKSEVEQQEILQHFISLSSSLKSNSWHLEAIWSRSMGLTPIVICLTALGDSQGRCVCGSREGGAEWRKNLKMETQGRHITLSNVEDP